MHPMIRTAALALGSLALAAPLAAQEAPGQEGQRQYVSTDPAFSASLGGTGNFTGVLDRQTNALCYILNAGGVTGPTAAHIHAGAAGESGAPVVPLATPEDGASGGCVTLEADLAQALLANPGGYYVNVHNDAFPGGAVRAQLRGQGPAGSG